MIHYYYIPELKNSFILLILILNVGLTKAQKKSSAETWMQACLEMIKQDGGGPTIHSRNLFHLSAAMYDAWAVYNSKAETYLIGKQIEKCNCDFISTNNSNNVNLSDSAREVTINFAAYRLLRYRFNLFGTKGRTLDIIDNLFDSLGYERNNSIEYQSGSAAALGNYIAQCYIDYGLNDGSNEEDEYENLYYNPINGHLNLNESGTQNLKDINRWQPIKVSDYYYKKDGDKSLKDYHLLQVLNQDIFLSANWGNVLPFSLKNSHLTYVTKDNSEFPIYLDPGSPPQLNFQKDSISSENYKLGFLTNIVWSSYLDPSDSIYIDISPSKIGNYAMDINSSKSISESYNKNGLSITTGHKINPHSKKPYKPNRLLRGDYGRVIAEYWVDGVDTYGPPGHWMEWLMKISNDSRFERRWQGKGRVMDSLEWDLKAYLTLSGALHDAAIAAWSIKAAYDYIRPISAIRYMAEQGQCTDESKQNYHPHGLPLLKGKIELIKKRDELAGKNGENLGKLKMFCWRGPDYINNAQKEKAGVGWILAENWWPYQRFSFVTPPFAGYVSGHSTFSFAAAEVLTTITGDPFFPGGLAEFTAKKNEYLLFEEGPSKDVTLQWATYFDAANETAISRIWGGIHPPCDDIEGRKIGIKIGKLAVEKASTLFNN